MKSFAISDVILVQEVSASDLGLHYQREVLSERTVGDREEVEYTTRRVLENKPEALRAKAVYAQARAALRKVCTRTVLGLVCPVSEEVRLEATLREIEALVAEANAGFSVCELVYSAVPIRLEHANDRAREALRREIQKYGERLVEAVRACDPEAIRRTLRSGKGLEALVADAELRRGLEEMNGAVRKAARVMADAIRRHDGDLVAAGASERVKQVSDEVTRRFPWAAAFESATVASGEEVNEAA